MKRLIKILLGIVAAIVLVAIGAAVVLPILYDTDDLKRTLEARVSRQTGRELRIAGDLDFSVFPWLAVEVNELSLSNAAGFGDEPMARIGQARVGVALMPLLRRELVADEITLSGLDLDLAVDAGGRSNWEDLVPEDTGQPPPGREGGPFATRRIAGLNIRDANIELRDRQAGTHYVLSGFDLRTGALGLGAGDMVPIELSMRLEDRVADLGVDVSLGGRASANLAEEQYALSDMELELALAGGGTLVLTAPSAGANLARQTLAIDPFSADLGGLRASGSLKARNILEEPSFSGQLQTEGFSPRVVMDALGIQAPRTADPYVLTSASLKTAFEGSTSAIAFEDLALILDDSKLNGEFRVRDFDRPRLRFDLAIDDIDLDRYMAPAADEDTGEQQVALPGEMLEGLDVEGTLRAAKLHLAGFDLTDAVVGVEVKNNRLRLHPLTAGFYGGTYEGDITLDASGEVPVLSLDENLESIVFQRLAGDVAGTDRLSGTALGHLKATGRGATVDEVLKNLSGNIDLRLDEGALEGINLWYEIRKGLALYRGQAAPAPEPDRTVFSRMQLEGTIDGGVLRTRELLGQLPFLTLSGEGTIDLASQQVDLGLVAAVRNVPELADDPLAADLMGKSMPLRVRGSLTDPGVSVDFAEMLKKEATDRLLGKLLGEDEAAAEGQEKSESDQRKDAARDLLRGLLGDKEEDEEEDDGGN